MTTPSNAQRHAVVRELVVLAAYFLLTALATYPLLFHFASALPPGGDTWSGYWDIWWMQRALVKLRTSPFFTSDVHYPYGASLYFHTLNLLQSTLVIPIAGVFGLTPAYNALVFLGFTLSGYGMYRLVLYLLRREDSGTQESGHEARLAAFLAGVAFTFCSYHFAHLHGHLDLVQMQWLPFFTLFLCKLRDRGRWTDVAGCALFFVASALTAFYYAMFLGVFAVAVVLWDMPSRRRAGLALAGRLALAAGLAAVLIAPVLAPMLLLGRTVGRTIEPGWDAVAYSTDLATFLMPSPLHPLWGRPIVEVYQRIFVLTAGYEQVAFLGYVPLALSAVALWRPRPGTWMWFCLAALFALLALGPIAHVMGRPVPVVSQVMPYRLLSQLPYGDIPRVPARFVVMTMLGVSVLSGFGMRSVLSGRSRRASGCIVAAASVLVIFENGAAPLAVTSPEVPTYIEQLRTDRSRTPLLELPIPDDPSRFPVRMLYQTHHEHPIYGGYLSRGLPPIAFDAIPGFRQFKTLSASVDDVVRYDPSSLPALSQAVLYAFGSPYIVIEKQLLGPAQSLEAARAVANHLLGEGARVHEDSQILAYSVPTPEGHRPIALWLDAGWSRLEHLSKSAQHTHWRWMADSARLAILSPVSADVHLHLRAQAFGKSRRLRLSAGDQTINELSFHIKVSDAQTRTFHVPAGMSFVDLRSLDGADSPGDDPRRLSIALLDLDIIAEE